MAFKVWEDPWLPKSPPFTVNRHTPRRNGIERVSDLIDGDSKTWNSALVRECFNKEDSDLILSIPVSTTQRRDYKIWHPSSTGLFSVKSAYHLEKEGSLALPSNQRAQTSSAGVMPLFWNGCGGCLSILRSNFFAWKCFHEAVATNSALMCPVCGRAEESICHLLFLCDFATRIWIHSPFRLRLEEIQSWRYISDWWSCIHDRIKQAGFPSSTMGLSLVYRWWIWRARNDLVF